MDDLMMPPSQLGRLCPSWEVVKSLLNACHDSPEVKEWKHLIKQGAECRLILTREK